jgi:hypothetical protein
MVESSREWCWHHLELIVDSSDRRMVIGNHGRGAQSLPSKFLWMLSPGVSSSSAVVFAPMLIKLVKWFPSTTNAYFIFEYGPSVGRSNESASNGHTP